MARKEKDPSCCTPPRASSSCCRVDSLVTVDHRGQMVLPKELREKAGIKAGDKLAIMVSEKEGKICCITLIKSEEITDLLKDRFGPIMKEIYE